jgi:ABC-type molybdate transport system substrate-binding protein
MKNFKSGRTANTARLVAVILILTFITLAVFYASSNGWIVNATTSINSQTSPIQRVDLVSVMYAASLLKTFEESIGPAFQADTGYSY